MKKSKKSQPIPAVVSFTNTAYRADATGLSLDELVAKNPASTFFMRIDGQDWAELGVNRGDTLVIDRKPTPKANSLVVAVVDGEMVVRVASTLKAEEDAQLWGLITFIIRPTEVSGA